MATAIRRLIEPETPPPTEVVLTLSLVEAQFVRDVLSLVGGSTDTRRKHADSIIAALDRAGMVSGFPLNDISRNAGYGVYFK